MSLRGWLPLFAALLLGALFGLHRIVELDLFQHIAVGRAILSDPSTIGLSQFHHTVPAYGYVADKWLASVLAAILDRLGGEPALMLYQMLLPMLVAAGCFTLFRAFGASRPLALLGVSLALAACAFRLEPRPDTLSLALLGFTITSLRSSIRSTSRLLWFVPVLFVLWINLHGYFIIGLLSMLAAIAAAALGDREGPSTRRGLMLLGITLLACILHPQGYRALAWPVRQLWELNAHPYLREAILEFQPTLVLLDGAGAWRWILLALTVLFAALFGFSSAGRRDGTRAVAGVLFALPWLIAPPPGLLPWPYRITFALLVAALFEIPDSLRRRRLMAPMLLAGFTLLAIPIIRNLSLVPIASLALLTPPWSRALAQRWKPKVAILLASIAFAILGWARLADHLPPGGDRSPGWTGWGIDRSSLPAEAADVIEHMNPPGLLLNHFDNGGYLLYRFHPERKAFISGNTSMYPAEFFREFHFKVVGRHADPEALVQDYGVEVAVLDHASPETSILVGKLAGCRSWKLVHLDRAAAVFVHDARESIEGIDLDMRAAELLAVADSARPLPAWLLPRRRLYPALNLGLFLRAVGRPDLALNEADTLWRDGPHARLAIFSAAVAEEMADLPRAIPRLRWALDKDGKNAAVRSWLTRALYLRAIAALEEGRISEARSDLGELLALSPDEPGALLALARIEASDGNLQTAGQLLCTAIELGRNGEVRRVAEADPLLFSLLGTCK